MRTLFLFAFCFILFSCEKDEQPQKQFVEIDTSSFVITTDTVFKDTIRIYITD